MDAAAIFSIEYHGDNIFRPHLKPIYQRMLFTLEDRA